MTLADSALAFVVSLLVGGLAIHVGARVVADVTDYRRAVVTAFLGALAWGLVSFLVGWIPVVGPLVVLVVYVAVIAARYPGGLVDAAGIALVAWVAALFVLWLLASLGVGSYSALGVPGA